MRAGTRCVGKTVSQKSAWSTMRMAIGRAESTLASTENRRHIRQEMLSSAKNMTNGVM